MPRLPLRALPFWITTFLGVIAPFHVSKALAAPTEAADTFQDRVLPLLEEFCFDCHADGVKEGGISFDGLVDQASAVKGGAVWLKALDALEGRVMPPADMPQPTSAQFDAVIAWIEDDFFAAQCDGEQHAPPVVIRRMNRQEYDNTLRDLLGLDLRLGEAFPTDEIGFGYDNVGSALNVSPSHVEKYLDAAELAMSRAIVLPDAAGLPPIELIGLKTYPLPRDKPVEFDHSLKPGRYLADFSLVRVGVAESVPAPRLSIGLGRDRRTLDAVRAQDETIVYRFWLNVVDGDKKVYVALAPGQAESRDVANPTEVTANVSGDQRYGGDRGLHVDSLVVRGPVAYDQEKLSESHRTIMFCRPEFGDDSRLECARQVIRRFADRAFRRPASEPELERILALFRLANDRGESFERAIQVALSSVLASPQFLFLVEPEDSSLERRLTEFELASRLSYFLWSSMPDENLFAEAAAGTLGTNLRAQVARMLADPKADALVRNFAGQWLQLRKLAGVSPDSALFPGFDDGLRNSMRRETEEYVGYILRNDRSVLELLDSDYTFANEALARHYGLEGVKGDQFQRISLADHRRGGVLTQASILTLTSNPNRTSPVKRGQWVLQQILGTPPPPPPPEVPKLDDSAQAADVSSLRERMEAHRANPECASCHQQMDPLGFAFENYDAVGRWRARDGGFPIDASGELLGGRKFVNASELKVLLGYAERKKFTRCLIENLLTYALGRGLDPADYCTIESIRGNLAASDYRMQSIINAIVESRAFQYRASVARNGTTDTGR